MLASGSNGKGAATDGRTSGSSQGRRQRDSAPAPERHHGARHDHHVGPDRHDERQHARRSPSPRASRTRCSSAASTPAPGSTAPARGRRRALSDGAHSVVGPRDRRGGQHRRLARDALVHGRHRAAGRHDGARHDDHVGPDGHDDRQHADVRVHRDRGELGLRVPRRLRPPGPTAPARGRRRRSATARTGCPSARPTWRATPTPRPRRARSPSTRPRRRRRHDGARHDHQLGPDRHDVRHDRLVRVHLERVGLDLRVQARYRRLGHLHEPEGLQRSDDRRAHLQRARQGRRRQHGQPRRRRRPGRSRARRPPTTSRSPPSPTARRRRRSARPSRSTRRARRATTRRAPTRGRTTALTVPRATSGRWAAARRCRSPSRGRRQERPRHRHRRRRRHRQHDEADHGGRPPRRPTRRRPTRRSARARPARPATTRRPSRSRRARAGRRSSASSTRRRGRLHQPVDDSRAAPTARTRVSVRATDAAGNTDATPATRAFTVTTAPASDITAARHHDRLGPDGPTNDSTPTFASPRARAARRSQCQVDLGAWAACTSPWTTPALADGATAWRSARRTRPGNTDASPATRSFTRRHAGPEHHDRLGAARARRPARARR